METQSKTKKLVKILIGAAWIDGKIQPEERKHLHQIAAQEGMADDPELRPWLYELKPVSPAECHTWIREYLGPHPTAEDCRQLIEATSALLYSDGDIANQEAKLLTQLQLLVSETTESGQLYPAVVKAVQKLYYRWIAG